MSIQRIFEYMRVLTVVVASLTLAPTAWADLPVTYKDGTRALFSVSAPDFWTVRAGGARELAAPGEEARDVARVMAMYPFSEPRVWVGFISPHGVSNFDQAADYLRDIGPFLVKEPQIASRKSLRINGLAARSIAGSGKRKGKAVNFTALLIDLPHGRMAISVVVMEAGIDPAITDDVNAIFGSFRAIR